MKKRILGIIIPLITSVTMFAQDYIMFEQIYLEPLNGQVSKLVDGVKKHNAKYHDGKNGPKAYLFYVWTGPYSGQYVWVKGPVKWTDMDNAIADDSHTKDWEMNVDRYGRSHNIMYSVRDEDLTYNPANETVGENVLIRVLDVTNSSEAMPALTQMVKEIRDVLEKTGSTQARRVYRNRFRSEQRRDLTLVYPFQSWEYFENSTGLPPGFSTEFEKTHGEGSMKKMVGDVLSKYTDGRYDEVRTMVK